METERKYKIVKVDLSTIILNLKKKKVHVKVYLNVNI